MPATIPPKPVSGAQIQSAWGDDIHERVYNPAGAFASGAVRTGISAEVKLPLDTLSMGNAAFLDIANDQFMIPDGMSGLYLVNINWQLQNTNTWGRVRPYKNGTAHVGGSFCWKGTSGTGVGAQLSQTYFSQLNDGEIIDIRGQGDAADPCDITIIRAGLVRVGHAMAAAILLGEDWVDDIFPPTV